jgi:hypothetical protein
MFSYIRPWEFPVLIDTMFVFWIVRGHHHGMSKKKSDKNPLNLYFYLINCLFVIIFRVIINISGISMTFTNERKNENFDFNFKRLIIQVPHRHFLRFLSIVIFSICYIFHFLNYNVYNFKLKNMTLIESNSLLYTPKYLKILFKCKKYDINWVKISFIYHKIFKKH